MYTSQNGRGTPVGLLGRDAYIHIYIQLYLAWKCWDIGIYNYMYIDKVHGNEIIEYGGRR